MRNTSLDFVSDNRIQSALGRQMQDEMDQAERALARDTYAGAFPFGDLPPYDQRGTVLVVDDDASIAELLGEVLEGEGYRVLQAANGRMALAIARCEHPVLVLTDRNMPELDGIEFVRLLRASAVTNDIPVVLMSSTRPDMQDVGNIPFLAKPFDLDDLIVTVATYATPPALGEQRDIPLT